MLRLFTFTVVIVLAATILPVSGQAAVRAQSDPGSSGSGDASSESTYTVYLANFSTGRAVFMLYSKWPAWIWDQSIIRKVVCDLPSQSFFAPTSVFPQNACRIFVEVTHEWYLHARVIYACEAGSEHCLGGTREYWTRPIHLVGIRAGAIYEYAACGSGGTEQYNCGWREIIQQDRKY